MEQWPPADSWGRDRDSSLTPTWHHTPRELGGCEPQNPLQSEPSAGSTQSTTGQQVVPRGASCGQACTLRSEGLIY